jgi:(E)-4-hydroxy-3-methylbut-2-enyl-diphosphate synthase
MGHGDTELIFKRRTTRLVTAGNVGIGGESPVSVQSMTNTPTSDAAATIAQVRRLAALGAELVRISVPDDASADALPGIVEQSPVPLVADIHFRADLALRALEARVSKLRLNPGNISRKRDVLRIAEKASGSGTPIRVGINSGSVPGDLRTRYGGLSPDSLWAAARRHLDILEEAGFTDVVLSIKASDPLLTVAANRRAAWECDYPLHIGVTEAGPPSLGAARSAVAASLLFSSGIGDTLRVSLSGPPEAEVPVAWEILQSLRLRRGRPRLVSCPTCARCRVDVAGLAAKVQDMLSGMEGEFVVAVMGCEVNGPGEARDADLAVVGTPAGAILFSGGRRLSGVLDASGLEKALEEGIRSLAGKRGGSS